MKTKFDSVQGAYLYQNMKMKISHPRLLIPGSSGDLGLEFPDCLKKQTSSEGRNIQAEIMHKSGGLLFSFPTVSVHEFIHFLSEHNILYLFKKFLPPYRMPKLMGEIIFNGLFGYILQFREKYRYTYLYITKWRTYLVICTTAHCACFMKWR